MDTKTVNTLIDTKGDNCISMIIPTFRFSLDRQLNTEIIRKATTKIKDLLDSKAISAEDKHLLLSELESLTKNIDVTHLMDGLGFFISPKVFHRVEFPFPVEEKIIVSDTFETRDLFYLQHLLASYHALIITKKIVRLFAASGNTLEEIKDNHFPLKHEDEYEYAPPTPGTSYGGTLKAFEKDKGTLSATRFRSTLKQADDMLSAYVSSKESKIILVGTKNLLSDFERLTDHKERIAGRITGSYNEKNFAELPNQCWSAYVNHLREESKLRVKDLEEKNIRDVVYGIRDVWKATQEGKGLMLLVEKDYRRKAYKKVDDVQIHLSPGEGYTTLIPDAVDDVIEQVYGKNGKVVFVDKNELENFDHIALVLRFR